MDLIKPLSIYVEPTNHCNQACSFCFHGNGAMTRKKGFMSFELFHKLISEVEDFKPVIVLHHSGEPLLHPYLRSLVQCAKNAGLRVCMTTNGSLIDDEYYGVLDFGFDEVSVSLTPLNLEKVRNLGFFKRVRKSKTRVVVNVVQTRDNKDEIEELRKALKGEPGIDEFIVRPLMDWHGAVEVSKTDWMRSWVYKWARLGYKYWLLASKGTLCPSVNESAGVLWDGTIVPCCLDFNAALPLGNLKYDSFIKVWNGERATALRKMMKSPKAVKKHPVCGKCVFQ